jgi:epoxyqueuosine reductase
LDNASLLALWAWTEDEFLHRTEGSAIRRIGHARWLRNIATALGNVLAKETSNAPQLRSALQSHAAHKDAAVREHVAWALGQANSS